MATITLRSILLVKPFQQTHYEEISDEQYDKTIL